MLKLYSESNRAWGYLDAIFRNRDDNDRTNAALDTIRELLDSVGELMVNAQPVPAPQPAQPDPLPPQREAVPLPDNEEIRTCTKCRQTKPLADFPSNGRGGKRNACKCCMREHWRTARNKQVNKQTEYLHESEYDDDPAYFPEAEQLQVNVEPEPVQAEPEPIPNPQDHKTCIKCMKSQPFSNYSPTGGKSGQLRNVCKSCTNERYRQWRRGTPIQEEPVQAEQLPTEPAESTIPTFRDPQGRTWTIATWGNALEIQMDEPNAAPIVVTDRICGQKTALADRSLEQLTAQLERFASVQRGWQRVQ